MLSDCARTSRLALALALIAVAAAGAVAPAAMASPSAAFKISHYNDTFIYLNGEIARTYHNETVPWAKVWLLGVSPSGESAIVRPFDGGYESTTSRVELVTASGATRALFTPGPDDDLRILGFLPGVPQALVELNGERRLLQLDGGGLKPAPVWVGDPDDEQVSPIVLPSTGEIAWLSGGVVYASALNGANKRVIYSNGTAPAESIATTDGQGRLQVLVLEGEELGVRAVDPVAGTATSVATGRFGASAMVGDDGERYGWVWPNMFAPKCVESEAGATLVCGTMSPNGDGGYDQWELDAVLLAAGLARDKDARRFRPRLLFDSGEKWRPLNVAALEQERQPASTQPLNRLCTPVAWPLNCQALTVSGLTADSTQSDFLDLGTIGGQYRAPDLACNADAPELAELLDCDSGRNSTMYVHTSQPSGSEYTYHDYWWFLRFNDFGQSYSHQGDWEGVTVAVRDDASTFDFASFSQHGHPSTYLRHLLECDDGGELSCGDAEEPTGKRLRVYSAAGTHASYPWACPDHCVQASLLPEGDHDGTAPWGGNDEDASLGAMQRLPEGPSSFTTWRGSWGQSAGAGSGVRSPGRQKKYECPQEGNADDPTSTTGACAASARVATSSTPHGCAPWAGAGIAVAVCNGGRLANGLKHGLKRAERVRVRVTGVGRARQARARGITQVAGGPLSVGDVVVVDGAVGRGWKIGVRVAVSERRTRTFWRTIPRGSGARLVVVRTDGRVRLRLESRR